MTEDLYAGDEEGKPEYLFRAQADSEAVFHGIQEDMERLNDFCAFCIQKTEERLEELNRYAGRSRSGKNRDEDSEMGDITAEVRDGILELEIPNWTEIRRVHVRAMTLLLLGAFTEMSLKVVMQFLCPSESAKFALSSDESSVDQRLRFLREVCKIHFDEPAESLSVRMETMELSAAFARGEWQQTSQAIASLSLPTAFDAISTLLRRIDRASAIT